MLQFTHQPRTLLKHRVLAPSEDGFKATGRELIMHSRLIYLMGLFFIVFGHVTQALAFEPRSTRGAMEFGLKVRRAPSCTYLRLKDFPGSVIFKWSWRLPTYTSGSNNWAGRP